MRERYELIKANWDRKIQCELQSLQSPSQGELYDDLFETIEAQEAEIKRLRSALKEITKDDQFGNGMWTPYYPSENMYRIAKEALRRKE